jgi:peptidylprolyl isomerase
MANTAQNGSNVTIHYVGTLTDGTQFDSSRERGEPMTITLGDGQLITGFNDALIGMAEGETKEFTIASDDAYGPHHEDRLTPIDRSIFPENFEFTTGMTVPLQNDTGQNFLAVITEIADDTVTADFNHPLAGKDLTFTVDVLAVSENEDTDS